MNKTNWKKKLKPKYKEWKREIKWSDKRDLQYAHLLQINMRLWDEWCERTTQKPKHSLKLFTPNNSQHEHIYSTNTIANICRRLQWQWICEHREWFTLPYHTIPYHTTIPYFAFASGSIQFLNSMLNISIFSLWLLLLLHGQTAIWAKLFHSEQALSLQHSTRQRNRFQSLMQLSSFTLYRCNQKFFPAAYSRLA